jgi:hypothetical protein
VYTIVLRVPRRDGTRGDGPLPPSSYSQKSVTDTPRRAPSRVIPWGGAEAGTAASGRDARDINFVRRGARSVTVKLEETARKQP